MLRRGLGLTLCLSFLGMNACRAFSSPTSEERLDDNKTYWFEYDATKRGAFLLVQDIEAAKKNRIRVISEPAPDVALATVGTLLASLDYKGANADVQAQIAENIVELGGRTQAVLVLREALFRLSEVYLNGGLEASEIKAIFGEAIRASENIARAELEKQTTKQKLADAKKAESEKRKSEADVEIMRMKIQQDSFQHKIAPK